MNKDRISLTFKLTDMKQLELQQPLNGQEKSADLQAEPIGTERDNDKKLEQVKEEQIKREEEKAGPSRRRQESSPMGADREEPLTEASVKGSLKGIGQVELLAGTNWKEPLMEKDSDGLPTEEGRLATSGKADREGSPKGVGRGAGLMKLDLEGSLSETSQGNQPLTEASRLEWEPGQGSYGERAGRRHAEAALSEPGRGQSPVRPLRWPSGGRRPPRWGGPRRRRRLRLPMAAAGIAALAVLLPALLVHRGGVSAPQAGPAAGLQAPAAEAPPAAAQRADGPAVSVYLTDTGAVETLPLEQYVLGVLAAEMPSSFGIEAMKAQAIATRTFIVKRLAAGDRSGVPGSGADVTDTVAHQAYLSKAELAAWNKAGKSAALLKLQKAVNETAGTIMTYKGQPISALFFSASGGYTENSEDYYKEQVPYLRSVASPWDAEIDPDYKETVKLPLQEVYSKLGMDELAIPAAAVKASADQKVQTSQMSQTASSKLVTVLSRTKGESIKEIQIGGGRFTGREVREKLGLRSSRFDIKVEQGEAAITTYGYGHGVGMSQWGANGMAKEGYSADEILKHYYTGITLEAFSRYLR